MRKRVWSTPVAAPARSPPPAPAAVAIGAETPPTRSAAAIEAPRVKDPSVVMSGKWKTRKLTNTPSARSARIEPIVSDPSSSVMRGSRPGDPADRGDPTDTSCELALAGSDALARIVEQVEHRLEDRSLEERSHRLAQLEAAAGQRAVRERGRVEMARGPLRAERPEPRRELGLAAARGRPDHERLAVPVDGLRREREPISHFREPETRVGGRLERERAAQRGAHETARLGHHHDAGARRVAELEAGRRQLGEPDRGSERARLEAELPSERASEAKAIEQAHVRSRGARGEQEVRRMAAVARQIRRGSPGGEHLAEAHATILVVAAECADAEAEALVGERGDVAIARTEGAVIDACGIAMGDAFERRTLGQLADLDDG